MSSEEAYLVEVPKATRSVGTWVYAIDEGGESELPRVAYGKLAEYRAPLGLWQVDTSDGGWFLQSEDRMFDGPEQAEAALSVLALAGAFEPLRIWV